MEDGDLVLPFLQNTIPDIIILDWQMARIDGLEVLRVIKSNVKYKDIPIIIITGLERIEILEQAFDYGANDFLVKPVNKKELTVRILNLIRIKNNIEVLNKEKNNVETLNEIISDQNKKLQEDSEMASIELIDFRNKIAKFMSHLKFELNNLKNSNTIVEKDRMSLDAILDSINSFFNQKEEETNEIGSTSFNQKLLSLSPNLTSLDLQHCSLLRENKSNDEIAKLLFIETKSLQTKRYRLKKKLRLDKDVSLRKFLIDM